MRLLVSVNSRVQVRLQVLPKGLYRYWCMVIRVHDIPETRCRKSKRSATYSLGHLLDTKKTFSCWAKRPFWDILWCHNFFCFSWLLSYRASVLTQTHTFLLKCFYSVRNVHTHISCIFRTYSRLISLIQRGQLGASEGWQVGHQLPAAEGRVYILWYFSLFLPV